MSCAFLRVGFIVIWVCFAGCPFCNLGLGMSWVARLQFEILAFVLRFTAAEKGKLPLFYYIITFLYTLVYSLAHYF